MASQDTKLRFPRVKRARFRHFTLYDKKPQIELTFPRGVFCLAGANGLGKSTFLLAINYAITGRVPDPNRQFISLEDYYAKTEDFTQSFFDGRISEGDRDRAEIEVELIIGSTSIILCRGMFEPDRLRRLSCGQNGSRRAEITGGPAQLDEAYKTEITKRTGVASFQQLVFLQHFVVTFDERRHLLFWQQRELEQTLFLAFGLSSEVAKRADYLRDRGQKADSYARNAVWQASVTRKKVRDLEQALSNLEDTNDIESDYKDLQAAADEASVAFTKTEAVLRYATMRLAELSARRTTLRAEYEREFTHNFAANASVQHHPTVRNSIAGRQCQLCNTPGDAVVKEIEKRIASHLCPLCGTRVGESRNRKQLGVLKDLDKQLVNVTKDVNDAFNRVQRLQADFNSVSERRDVAAKSLEAFSRQNKKELARLEARGLVNVKAVLDEYSRQIDELEREKAKWYKRRDVYREELRPIQRRLEQQYRDAEGKFVPMFKELAESFLGVDLNVVFELSKSAGVTLVLDVEEGERREFHQLSESQRFFVDIALRMALIKYMSARDTPGCLYLDTPEGSLDIAYETRAGRMIAQFVTSGFGCVMTANINTSRLLISLAEDCGSKNMTLHRMTTWAQLTDVQTAEETLFNNAFKHIEKKLKRKRG